MRITMSYIPPNSGVLTWSNLTTLGFQANISYFFRSWIFSKIGFVDSSECDFRVFLRFRNFGIIVLLSIVYKDAQIFLVVF